MSDELPGSLADVLAGFAHGESGSGGAPPDPDSIEKTEPEAPSLDPNDPIHRFLDLPLRVSVQLDRKRVRVCELLELRTESVLKLDRSAGENVDLLINGLRAGSGEIVVIEDAMGLRITDLEREERGEHRK